MEPNKNLSRKRLHNFDDLYNSKRFKSEQETSSIVSQKNPPRNRQHSLRNQPLYENNGARKRYSANDRLKQLRRSLVTDKSPSFEHRKPYSPTDSKKCSATQHSQVVSAKPSTLTERIDSIRKSNEFNFSKANDTEYHFKTPSAQSNVNKSITPVVYLPSTSNSPCYGTPVDADNDLMQWEDIEERQVLSKITEIRNDQLLISIDTSTNLKILAKEFVEIPKNETILKEIYIVVDTNIFISHLDIVAKLLTLKINGVVAPIVLIPWIVIQELDFLKECTSEKKLKRYSQAAIRFINEKLSQKHPQLKGDEVLIYYANTVNFLGQSIQEATQQFPTKNADDSILYCCMQIMEKENRAMLVSNDINLRNKAIIQDIFAYSHKEIIQELQRPHQSLCKNHTEKVKDIETHFVSLFSFFILIELKNAYGSALNHMYPDLQNTTWTLTQCLKMFEKFWQSIFSVILQKQFVHKVTQFSKFLVVHRTIERFNETDSKHFVDYGLEICIYIKNALTLYREKVEDCINTVNNISSTL
ncbi:hypothetical protein FQA39_LY03994 [Lamprigera yunnana]|nr:hypothetical protein FQA39_LY03994 [Lamprigera yunnana]